MRLGISAALKHDSPKDWAEQMARLGCKAVVFPVDYTAPDRLIADYVDAAHKNDLVIAEVGIWKNVFAVDEAERRKARERAVHQLRLADEIGAVCCVNLTGTYGGPVWDGGYKENYTKECWERVVAYTQDLLDEVNPTHTKYSVEPMPWMIPTGPDEYLRLLDDVNREGFGIHMDFVNMINTPERYFFSDEFMDECFEKLGPLVCSCHLKDIRLKTELTFQLEETCCGNGTLNIEKYMQLMNQYNPDMPVLIEHLKTDQEYISSLDYVKQRLKKKNIL